MLNKIVIMGRLTRDPELRQTPSGVNVASFSIACDRDFKDKQTGEKQTDFIDIVAWRNTADFVSRYFAKGRMAVVEGRLQIRSWQDQNGNNRRTAEGIAENIYFGDSRPAGEGGYQASSYGAPPARNEFNQMPESRGGYDAMPESQSGYQDILEDEGDLPF